MMKSLASIHDAVDIMYDRLDHDYVNYIFPAFFTQHITAAVEECKKESSADWASALLTDKDEWPKFLRRHKKMLRHCDLIQPNVTLLESVDIIENDIMPQFYWSSAIPLLVLVVSIGWLTAVEGGSSRFMKAMGYSFVSSVVIQIVLQFAFIGHFHGQLTVS